MSTLKGVKFELFFVSSFKKASSQLHTMMKKKKICNYLKCNFIAQKYSKTGSCNWVKIQVRQVQPLPTYISLPTYIHIPTYISLSTYIHIPTTMNKDAYLYAYRSLPTCIQIPTYMHTDAYLHAYRSLPTHTYPYLHTNPYLHTDPYLLTDPYIAEKISEFRFTQVQEASSSSTTYFEYLLTVTRRICLKRS